MSNLKAIKRETTSSGSINKLRESGFIPAILYGGKNPNLKISIEKKAIRDIVDSDSFLSRVLEIEIDGKKEKVLPRDVAYHVVSEEPIHIDFMRIVEGKKVVIDVPVNFKNCPEVPDVNAVPPLATGVAPVNIFATSILLSAMFYSFAYLSFTAFITSCSLLSLLGCVENTP